MHIEKGGEFFSSIQFILFFFAAGTRKFIQCVFLVICHGDPPSCIIATAGLASVHIRQRLHAGFLSGDD
jgi:hypothetical protein